MVVQNPLDRVPGDVVAEIRERATDARVPPRWMLDRHPHHEVGHLAWRYRPASTSAGAAVVLPGNQPPGPAENRVRRDDAGDLRQHPPAEFLASHRESTALGVGQAKWTWAKLLPEDPILLPKIIDHAFLVGVHPASGREYEEAQSVGNSLRLLGKQPLAPTLFSRFANLGRFVAPYGVEAVTPGPGTGEDRVDEPPRGGTSNVPTEQILLRFTNAVSEKQRQHLASRKLGVISNDDGYVIAINSRGIPHAPYGNTLPFFFQAFLPIGDPTIDIDRESGRQIDSYYGPRETVTKANGSPVSTTIFLDRDYSFISAVIHSSVDCVNRPDVLGADFEVLHNPMALHPLTSSVLGWCRQYVLRDEEFKVHTGA